LSLLANISGGTKLVPFANILLPFNSKVIGALL